MKCIVADDVNELPVFMYKFLLIITKHTHLVHFIHK